MIGYINDYCYCSVCSREVDEAYRLLKSAICGECLEDLYIELEDKYA
jgi:hypothetical protein